MTTYSGVANVSGVSPHDPFFTWVPSAWTAGYGWKDTEGGVHFRVPQPQYSLVGEVPWPPQPGFYPFFPIKPLPQGAGGGGPVGTPIDSG